ncbi:MAG: AmmeMemoRadiSam system radical SAM enzyme [Parasporobacterium sp.]|nr:AmmeMemoRadiSam system radical SAM enzyme [Parasporobacterium sp.]
MAKCNVCFRHCEIKEGAKGFCGARGLRDGKIRADNYGRITSLALDPIEKKPLARFFPGSRILSVGSYGCNLRCPFCQNYSISWSEEAFASFEKAEYLSPEELTELAFSARSKGNIGLAFTYNEPLIGYEYVLDTARLSHERGMKNVMVTNGMAELSVLDELAPYIDAMNIDLKGFSNRFYRDLLQGDLDTVLRFIAQAVTFCHVELTTLIIPGENDSEEEIRALTQWVAALKDAEQNPIGKQIPLHISRFFPRFHMTDRSATPIQTVYHLAEIAREKLLYVYTGNC